MTATRRFSAVRSCGLRARLGVHIEICENAHLTCMEGHYHGLYGEVRVFPKATVEVGKGAIYQSDFSLTSGCVGELDIDYAVSADERALVERTARVFRLRDDSIRSCEKIVQAGEVARGLIKPPPIVVEDEA